MGRLKSELVSGADQHGNSQTNGATTGGVNQKVGSGRFYRDSFEIEHIKMRLFGTLETNLVHSCKETMPIRPH